MPPYSPIRSSFELFERPLRYFHDNIEPTQSFLSLRNCVMYMGGMVVMPIAVCATPLTMAADIVIGVAETAFCIGHGYRLREVAEVAKKKIIISPLHQLSFLIVTLAPAAAILSCLYGSYYYPNTLLHNLPKSQLIGVILIITYFYNIPTVEDPGYAGHLKVLPVRLRNLIRNRMVFLTSHIGLIAFTAWEFLPFLTQGELNEAKYFLIKASVVSAVAAISIFWMYRYSLSQRLIGSFPSSCNHHVFSIFSNRGAKDDSGLSYQDQGFAGVTLEDWERKFEEEFQTYRQRTTRNQNTNTNPEQPWRRRAKQEQTAEEPQRKPKQERMQKEVPANPCKAFWTRFLGKDRKKITSVDHTEPLYNEFRAGILEGKTALELLGLEGKPLESAVKKAYHKYAAKLHSDKNPSQREEADVLFRCLCEATSQLLPVTK